LKLQKDLLNPHLDDIDYILAGIHSLKMEDDKIKPIVAPGKKTEISTNLELITFRYLKQMEHLVSCGFFDVVAHFDNLRFFFLPNEVHYSDENWQYLLSILDKVKNKEMVIEVNTSGTWKGIFRQFPNEDILAEMIARDIHLTLGSDAHHPDYVGYGFDDFLKLGKKLGLKNFWGFNHREQRKIEI
jgi:histidinol-phosphatase (PHP family)